MRESWRHKPSFFLKNGFLLAILAIFTFEALYSYRSIDRLLDAHGQYTARQWADAFVLQENLTNTLLSGAELSDQEQRSLTLIANEGSVFRFKFFDLDGELVFSSEGETGPSESLTAHAPTAASRLFEGEPYIRLDEGEPGSDLPAYYAEGFVPLYRSGEIAGFAEVYVDQTESRSVLLNTLYPSLWLTLSLCIVAILHVLYTAWLMRREQSANDRAHHLARHDVLTGLHNRDVFVATLQERIAGKRKSDPGIAIHMIDLDGFKNINDRHGHGIGDELLRTVADVLLRNIRSEDLLARLGGDEFVAIQANVDNRQQAIDFASRMVASVREIRQVGNVEIRLSTSVGTYLLDSMVGTETEDIVLSRADAALYHAKGEGKDQVAIFEPEMEDLVRSRQLLRSRLVEAIENETLEVFYQPQHEAKTGRLCGFEALARLQDGEGGYVSPYIFIPLAEELRLMPRLGALILEQSCRDAVEWPDDLYLAVNLSVQQFEKGLVDVVRNALESSGLNPQRLELEITESMFIQDHDVPSIERQLHELKKLGVQIAMDDFGTGYSSLNSLWRFPFDKLKVDRSVVSQIDQSTTVNYILDTIAALGRTMRLRVTAEGVETEAQRTLAIQAGCDEIQGYFYAAPMAGKRVKEHISQVLAGKAAGADDISSPPAEAKTADDDQLT
ncbi:putative bifunctional diguanylate cyclase/phosphodiesterase [Notoacmeibacter ruber]|uniref:EAL domain-containing protein n=1 Tax=Notoacmeibacter ruber TaxID=2670375 RepID=A0A3L7JCU3_9HYPH|nr:EAL domain-containing protein [Notoacmeibacter ruber]RLQ88567.1 EAL domain-containing protein [Notoacmeibacter ruber]